MMKHTLQKWTEPLFLLVIAILAYGLFIPRLGLFGDDWPHLWVLHTFGMEGLNQLVAWDRPFSSWVYALIAPLAGDHIWGYHIYLLIVRWLGAIIFFFLLNEFLGDQKPVPFWASAFLLLYPGFRQGPQPLEFILHFTVFDLMLFSFWCMIKAYKQTGKNHGFHIAGSLAALSIFSVEYFIGLELLRPVFLYFTEPIKHKNIKQVVLKIFVNWLPYMVILSGYAIWRVFVFKFPTYKPTFLSQVGLNPLEAVLGLAQVLVEEVRAAIFGAWRQIISLPVDHGQGVLYFLLILFGASILAIWLTRYRGTAEERSPMLPMVTGFLAIAFAGIPFWITGIPVQLEFPWDRSTLPFMLGASLLLCGILLLLKPVFRNSLAALIIALTIGMHFQNQMLYQVEWQKMSQFFWQLTWRAPSLEPGTIVISDQIPLFYYGDNNLSPVLNWTYAPENTSKELSYNFFDMGERLGKNLPDLLPDLPVEHGYRFVTFQSDSNSLLPVFYKEGSCLKIVDSRTALLPGIPRKLKASAKFSDPESRIQNGPQATPPEFIPEPVHGWCYYYQKAGYAAQQHNWKGVADLYSELKSKNLEPEDLSEWMPFIEGAAESGSMDLSMEISRKSMEQEGIKPAVCQLWSDMVSTHPEDQLFFQATQEIGCVSK